MICAVSGTPSLPNGYSPIFALRREFLSCGRSVGQKLVQSPTFLILPSDFSLLTSSLAFRAPRQPTEDAARFG